MSSPYSSRGASPECTCTTRPFAAAAAQIGSYDGSLYALRSCHIVGIMIPRMPGVPARRSISATPRSTSWVIGTSAMPARRSGACEQNSASQRLCAIAPAYASSGSWIVPADKPGAERR